MLTSLILTSALCAPAWAQSPEQAEETFYLEAPPVGARSDVASLQRQAQSEGFKARTIRRYEHGTGWQYVLVVEGFTTQGEAEQAAALLAGHGGHGIVVYRREGRTGWRLNGAGDGEAINTEVAVELPPASDVLQRAVRALGGQSGGAERLHELPSVHFTYKRTVYSDGQPVTAEHDLLRAGDSLRLDVRVLEGPGVGSLTILDDGKAWLSVDGGAPSSQDPARAREVLSGFTPEALLSYPLRFSALVDGDPVHARLRTQAAFDIAGRPAYRLVDAEGVPEGAMSLTIDQQTWWPVELRYAAEAGAILYRFSDWREVETGLVLPFHVEFLRDERPLEVLEISGVDFPTQVDDRAFKPPGTG